MGETVYVIDGTSICYRAFFAIKNLSTQSGFPTNAIYGFVNVLRKLRRKFNMEYCVVCFDTAAETFRKQEFSDYKIQRPPVPDDLSAQFDLIKKITSFWGIKVLEKDGFEADDLIAAIAEKAFQSNYKVIAITSDKDMLQIVKDKQVMLYDLNKDKFIDESYVKENFAVEPCHIPDYLALVGDAVDNIPGVKGIGPKAAFALMQQFGSVENLLSRLDSLPPRQKRLIEENKDNLKMSLNLTKLRCDIGMKINIKDFAVRAPDNKALADIFKDLEFSSFLKDILAPSEHFSELEGDIVNGKEFRKFSLKKKILLVYLSGQELYLGWDKKILKTDAAKIKDILEDSSVKKIGYDLKSLKIHLLHQGINLQGLYFDLMLASFLLKPALVNPTLERIAWEFLGQGLPEQKSSNLLLQIELYKQLKTSLAKNSLEKLFYEIEMPLLEVLVWMETWPLKLDEAKISKAAGTFQAKINQISQKIFNLAQEEFNLNSAKEVGRILYQKLKLPALKKTKTGFSTNEEVLLRLRSHHKIVPLILSYRRLNKLMNTYILPLQEKARLNNGHIFAKFSQVSAQTGRLISHAPNLQNVPVKTDMGKEIRGFFVPSFKGGVLLSSDYSQIELRVLAHLSKDKVLKEAFRKNVDIHKFTAQLIFDSGDVSEKERDVAKRINFAVIYGMGPHGLMQEMGFSFEQARSFIDNYFIKYPQVKAYLESLKFQAKKKGYVETIFGRRRYFPALSKAKGAFYEALLRQAINAPIQGSAAEIIKLAMIKIHKEFKQRNFSSRLMLQIHDELLFDVKKEELETVAVVVRDVMENAYPLDVPLQVNMKVGKNWMEMQKITKEEPR